MTSAPDKPKPSRIVQELCEKLKFQIEQLSVPVEAPPEEAKKQTHRKDLFKSLQDQIDELSR